MRRTNEDVLADNDMRGFFDGGLVHGWNQSTQTHVRLGRGPWTGKFGENEILRVLQRWNPLDLPSDVMVEGTALSLAVEKGPEHELDVLLYAVRGDWNPGDGGTLQNNTSPPAPGEVWWRDAEFGSKPWSLPGASFASDSDPRADTEAMPLAHARYRPNEPRLTFESARLSAYTMERARAGEPLLFLLKLSDPLEDTSGFVLLLYSADYGEHGAPERRPQLRVSWTSPAEFAGRNLDILIEPGRSVVLPRFETSGARFFALSFTPDKGSEAPWIEVRGGAGDRVERWRPVFGGIRADWEWLEVRILAARNPVAFGGAFETEIRDTWIRTKAPEDQRVSFEFVAPNGSRHNVDARYLGDFRWGVRFEPLELGRWSYSWQHDFVWPPHRGPLGVFDVVADDLEPVLRAVHRLRNEIGRSGLTTAEERVARFERRFHTLERAAVGLLGPEDFRSPRGKSVLALIGETRAALGSEPLPEAPSEWAEPWKR